MKKTIALIITLVIALTAAFAARALAAPHYEVDLTWTQPAPTTQTGYNVERKLGLTGTYQSLTPTPLGPAARALRDMGPYSDGQVVCHRVTALGTGGNTVFDEVCSNAPIQLPGKGTLQQQWQFLPN